MSREDIRIDPERLRANYKIISSSNEPVFSTDLPLSGNQCQQGLLFSSYYGNTDIPLNATSYLAMQVINPSNSARTVYMHEVRAFNTYQTATSSADYILITVVKDMIFASGVNPSAFPIYNRNLGSINTSMSSVNGLINSTTNPIGTGTTITQFARSITFEDIQFIVNGDIIVPAGHSLGINLYNASSKSLIITLDFSWYEI